MQVCKWLNKLKMPIDKLKKLIPSTCLIIDTGDRRIITPVIVARKYQIFLSDRAVAPILRGEIYFSVYADEATTECKYGPSYKWFLQFLVDESCQFRVSTTPKAKSLWLTFRILWMDIKFGTSSEQIVWLGENFCSWVEQFVVDLKNIVVDRKLCSWPSHICGWVGSIKTFVSFRFGGTC